MSRMFDKCSHISYVLLLDVIPYFARRHMVFFVHSSWGALPPQTARQESPARNTANDAATTRATAEVEGDNSAPPPQGLLPGLSCCVQGGGGPDLQRGCCPPGRIVRWSIPSLGPLAPRGSRWRPAGESPSPPVARRHTKTHTGTQESRQIDLTIR